MERITSRNNSIVKDTKRLMASSSERAKQALFVLEGARLCFDVLNSVYEPAYVMMTQEAYDRYGDTAKALIQRSERAYLISREVADKLGDTGSTQGIFAVCHQPAPAVPTGGRLLVLDRLQDPANVGTVLRTAEALGIDGIITYRCCDVYNPKVLRATMGGVLRMTPYDAEDLTALLQQLKKTHRLVATVPDAAACSITEADLSVPCACVIGNEANGVSEAVLALADERVTIPMQGKAESLNAGAAAAIAMWEMVRA
ncbi:MAG: RNA methyltransferase [Eubacterium sp.]|nr:RNA methyltransferase [Eubacterium sp.]